MTRKILSMLLALSMILTVLAACNETPTETPDEPDTPEVVNPVEPSEPEESETPEEPEVVEPAEPVYTETEVGAENTITNAGTTITLNVVDNQLLITNAATTASNVNLLAQNSVYALPKCYQTEFPSKETFDLNWVYTSTVKFENKEVNDSMTSGLIYNFEDTAQNVKLRVYCVVRDDLSGPFEFYTELENLNDTEFRIAPYEFATFTVDIPDSETTTLFTIKQEGWLAEGFRFSPVINDTSLSGTGIYSTKFADIRRYTSSMTTARSDSNTYMAQYIDRNGKAGLFYALEWTNGIVRVFNNNDETATVNISMDFSGKHTRFFSTEIPANETFLFPSVYLMPYDGSLDDGSNIYKNWFFKCKTISALRDNPNEPLIQIDSQLHPEQCIEVGIESIKWEYGWWNTHGFTEPHSLEGSWVLRSNDYKNYINYIGCETLADYGKTLKDYGLNWTLYLLLHDTADLDGNVTDQYGEFNSITHPEWFADESAGSAHRLADLGNVECVSYVKNTLTDFFNTNLIATWRTDFQPIVSVSEHENRHDANGTDVQYWATKGFFEIIDHLYDSVEGFRYECCSSGGRQKDIYTATRAVIFNVEDSANYLSMRAAFYDSSYVLHPAQLQFPCNPDFWDPIQPSFFPNIPTPTVAEGDNYDFRTAMLDMGYRSTILGVPHWGSWTNTPHVDYYTKYCTIYTEKVRPLVREAELYHILPRPDGTNWDGMMYADPDSENEIKGLVFLFKPSEQVENVKNVVFDGLYEDTVYQLTFEDRPEQNCTATGAELMTNGIDVEIKYIGSELIWITEAE